MTEPAKRLFADVSQEELDQAIAEMVDKLGISGSAAGPGYNLYGAIHKEWEKARRAVELWEEIEAES